jgi:hypothetical protein
MVNDVEKFFNLVYNSAWRINPRVLLRMLPEKRFEIARGIFWPSKTSTELGSYLTSFDTSEPKTVFFDKELELGDPNSSEIQAAMDWFIEVVHRSERISARRERFQEKCRVMLVDELLAYYLSEGMYPDFLKYEKDGYKLAEEVARIIRKKAGSAKEPKYFRHLRCLISPASKRTLIFASGRHIWDACGKRFSKLYSGLLEVIRWEP